MSTFKILLQKAYKASKLKQCFRLGNQNSVDLNLIFPHSISVCEQFQYVWLSGPAREENIWISKNSHAGKLLLPAHTWVTHEKYCFPLAFINFVRAPEFWSFQSWFESWRRDGYEQRSTYMADQILSHPWGQASPPTPSSLPDSSRTASCSPGLPSASVNASHYIPRGSSHLLALVSLDVSSILGTLHLYHVLKNYSAAAAIFCHWIRLEQSLRELPSSAACLAK